MRSRRLFFFGEAGSFPLQGRVRRVGTAHALARPRGEAWIGSRDRPRCLLSADSLGSEGHDVFPLSLATLSARSHCSRISTPRTSDLTTRAHRRKDRFTSQHPLQLLLCSLANKRDMVAHGGAGELHSIQSPAWHAVCLVGGFWLFA